MSLTDGLLRPQATNKFKGLLFGPPHSGKTTMLASARFDERIQRILWLGFDDNCHYVGAHEKIDLVSFPAGKSDFVVAIENFIEKLIAANENQWAGEPYDLVVLDSLTDIYDCYLRDIAEATSKASEWQAMPQKQHYGMVQNVLSSLIKQLMRSPIHFAMTAHVGTHESEPGVFEQIPLTAGTFGLKIVGKFTHAGLTQQIVKDGQTRSVVFFQKDRAHTASRGLQDRYIMKEPDYPIFTEWLNDLGA